MNALKYIAKIQNRLSDKIRDSETVGTCEYERNYCIRTGIPQRRGTKRTRRMFTSVADLGVFRGCQNRLESDRASAAAWGE